METKIAATELVGRLVLSQSDPQALYLAVPSNLVLGFYKLLNEPGIEEPDQVSRCFEIMSAAEVRQIGADRIAERGRQYAFTTQSIKAFPTRRDGYSKEWYLQARSPSLSRLRRSYNLSSEPLGGFGILLARRKSKVLQSDTVSRAD